MRHAWAALVAVSLALPAATAHADDDEGARAAMRRGIAAFARGETEAALAEYETAKRLAPAANAPYRYAAEVLASIGRWDEVVANLEAYLAKNPNVSNAAEVRDRITKIRAEHFPARLTVTANVGEALVSIDNQPKVPLGTVTLPPGAHHVEVSAPGKISSAQHLTLIGDREATVVFELVDAPIAPPVPSPPVLSPPVTEPPAQVVPATSVWRTVGWIGIGGGAVTLLTTFVVDAAVLGPKVSSYEAAADRGDPSARELRDDARDLQTGLLVSYVAGAVIGLGGAALVLFAPRGSTAVTPAAGPGYAGLSTRVVF